MIRNAHRKFRLFLRGLPRNARAAVVTSMFLLTITCLCLFMAIFVRPADSYDVYYEAAGIWRGETPEGCEQCGKVTACALIKDIEKGVVLRNRWYGYRDPNQAAFDAIAWARNPENCRSYTPCKFVGNGKDLETWAKHGWVSPDVKVTAYCNQNGCTVCVPEIQREGIEPQ